MSYRGPSTAQRATPLGSAVARGRYFRALVVRSQSDAVQLCAV